jgi:hypothetical protein
MLLLLYSLQKATYGQATLIMQRCSNLSQCELGKLLSGEVEIWKINPTNMEYDHLVTGHSDSLALSTVNNIKTCQEMFIGAVSSR